MKTATIRLYVLLAILALLLAFSVLWDFEITRFLVGLTNQDHNIYTVIAWASNVLLVILGIILGVLVLSKKQELSAQITAETGISVAWGFLFSQIIQAVWIRHRPFEILHVQPLIPHLANASFPSDYALVASTIATTLSFLHRKWGYLAWLLTASVCFARVAAGLHWVTDVLAGVFFGAALRTLLGRYRLGKRVLDPYSGIHYLTFSARISIAFAVLCFCLPPSPRFSTWLFSTKGVTASASMAYLFGTWLFYLGWRREITPYPSTESWQGLVPSRKHQTLIWAHILFDLGSFALFYGLSLDMNSSLSLCFLLCIIDSIHLRSPVSSLGVFLLALLGLGCSLLVIRSFGPGSTETLPSDPRRVLLETILPRVSSFFAVFAIVLWQLFRDDRLLQLMARASSSELFLSSLLQNVPHFIYRIDRRGKITYANQNFAELIGFPRERALGKTGFDLFPEELAKAYAADDERVMTTGQTITKIEQHKPPNKPLMSVQVIKRPLVTKNGIIHGLQGIFWDVTHITQAEERLKDQSTKLSLDIDATLSKLAATEEELKSKQRVLDSLLSISGEIIYTHDLEGRFTYINKAGQELLGYSEDEFTRLAIEDIVAPDQIERAKSKFAEKMKESIPGKRVTSYTLDVVNKSGKRIPLEVTSRLLVNLGRPTEVYGIAMSLLARSQAGALNIEQLEMYVSRFMEMRQSTENLKEEMLVQNKLLLSEVHHRIRNNLQVLISLVNEASEKVAHMGDFEVINILRKTYLRLSDMELIHNLLYRARDRSTISMPDYLPTLVGLVAREYNAEGCKITVLCNCAPIILPVRLANSVGIVVHELLSNSFRHAFKERGSGRIEVDLEHSGQDQIRLRLTDNGSGFSQNELAPLSGLQFTRQLIKRMKGTMELASDHGTSIEIIFPHAAEGIL